MSLADLVSAYGVQVPAPTPTGSTLVFWSAVDYPGEYQALLEASTPVGVAVKRMSRRVFDQLVRTIRATRISSPTPIFVDSGAYSESTGKFSDADWGLVLDRYQALADAGGARVVLVAPDEIGSFAGTEARLEKAAPRLRALLATGAHLLLPLQPGSGSLAEREARLRVAARLSDRRLDAQVHPALPWTNKVPDKPSMTELSAYVRTRRPLRLHFLGVGDQNPAWPALVAEVHAASPSTLVQGDSNRFGAMRAEGRPLTRAGQLVDLGVLAVNPFEEGDASLTDEDGETLGHYDESVVDLADWTTPEERRRIATEAGFDSAWVPLFVRDPSAFMDEVDSADWGYLHEAMDAAWVRRSARFAPDRRRHLATRRILTPPPPASALLRALQTESGRPVHDPELRGWLRDRGVLVVDGEFRLLAGRPNPEAARRRLADALEEDGLHGELAAFRARPPRRAQTLAELMGLGVRR